MTRYFKLYAYFLQFSISRAMEFRLDFFFRIVMDLLYYAVNISFYKLIFLHTSMLAGWNESQVMVFVGGYLVLDAVYMTIFSNNLWWLPIFINKGDLDYYLVRPVSSLYFLSLREFAANSFVNLLMALAILFWAVAKSKIPLSLMSLLFYLGLLLNGAFLHYLVNMMTVIPVFWTHSARGFQQVFWSLQRFMERPDRIYTGWVRKILVSILPFCLMTSFPARMILDQIDWGILMHIFAVTLCFFLALTQFWKIGLRAYSSASS